MIKNGDEMQVNNNSSTISFNGYKNLMTNSVKVVRNEGFSFLSMQLDNIKKNDLEIWKNIQERLFAVKNPSDIFTVELIEGFGLRTLLIGDKNISPCSSFSQQSEKERLLMQAYTWLAELTKRIMNENNPVKDSGAFEVFHKTVANILPLFQNNLKVANEFVLLSSSSDKHPQETAFHINKVIDKIMLDYFS